MLGIFFSLAEFAKLVIEENILSVITLFLNADDDGKHKFE